MNYRQTRNGYCNCNVAMFPGVGAYDVPEVRPAPVGVDELRRLSLLDFSHAVGCKFPAGKLVHFFTDDYAFECAWKEPRRYVDNLRRFPAVIGPDFSSYTDFPWAVQVFNHYRRQWLARYWQEQGVNIIPNVQFGYNDGGASLAYCLDGVPRGAIIATSTIGGMKGRAMREMWLERFEEVTEALKPSAVLLIGKVPEGIGERYGGEIITMESNTIKAKEAARDARKADHLLEEG